MEGREQPSSMQMCYLEFFLQIFVPDFETSTDHWWVMGGIMIKMTFDHYICLDL